MWFAGNGRIAVAQGLAASGFVPGEVLVQFKSSTSTPRRNVLLTARSARVLRHFESVDIDHIRLPPGRDVRAEVKAFLANPDVISAQPNYIRHLVANGPPNDPYWLNNTLWGMQRIEAQAVWPELLLRESSVVVASIDTGVDYTHPDLAANMWRNPGEIPGNGIDDDGNGYVDDVYGIDAYNHDSDPMDDHGHGTHTAGIIAAVGNNGVGVAGVHWKAQIIACKFISAQDYGDDAGAIECLNYLIALKHRGVNIRVTNNSWGGDRIPGDPVPSALQTAFDAAGAAGILSACAAGNASVNLETSPFDPASFSSDSIVAIAASDFYDNRAYYSNYGATSVDLAAPGSDILSTTGGDYGYKSGTSMATPHVAGAAALMAEFHPQISVDSLKSILLSNVEPLAQWTGLVVSGGRLNVRSAMQAAAALENPIEILALSRPAAGSFTVSWSSQPGLHYQILSTDNLAAPFIPLGGFITGARAETMTTFTDEFADGERKFYRVELLP